MNRETWLLRARDLMSGWFAECGATFPTNVRVSCGFPSKSALTAKRRRIGEAWSSACSGDTHFELFISPVLGEPVEVLATLIHEMVHAAVGLKAGHGPGFRRVAEGLGLEGKMTATVPGEHLTARLRMVIERLGAYPHAELKSMTNGRKTEATRMLKACCPSCGYTVRVTRKWIDAGLPTCSKCKRQFIEG